MRLSLIHVLMSLLIAIFALGAPSAAQADCARCSDCSARPTNNEVPYSHKSLACQITLNCTGQIQKMPVQTATTGEQSSVEAAFGELADAAVKLALIKPETSPPRL
ncbi:MAG TPA: hypothetical protein VFZ03_03885 [Dongiaceae bacterium]